MQSGQRRRSTRTGSIYDPNQDEREVAEIRQNYSKLLDEVHRHKSDLVSVESDRLSRLVERANSVQERSKREGQRSIGIALNPFSSTFF